MSYENDGLFGDALLKFRDLVCSSTTFRQLVGADNATQARNYALIGGDESEAYPKTLQAIIRSGGDARISGTSNSGFAFDSVPIQLLLELPVPASVKDYSSFYLYAIRMDGLILREMIANLRTNPSLYPDIQSIDNTTPMDVLPFEEENGRLIGVCERMWTAKGAGP